MDGFQIMTLQIHRNPTAVSTIVDGNDAYTELDGADLYRHHHHDDSSTYALVPAFVDDNGIHHRLYQ